MKHRNERSGHGRTAVAGPIITAVLVLSATALLAQQSPSLSEPWAAPAGNGAAGNGAWFTIGPVLRGGMKAKVTGSSYAQTLGAHAVANPLGDPPSVGAPAAYASRTYYNGYVGLSPSTGNPSAVDPNTTWNWGYNDSSNPSQQYDAGAGTLSFFKQGIAGYSATMNSSFSREDEMLAAGIEMSIGTRLLEKGKWSASLVFGFQGAWGANAKLRGSTYAEQIRRQDVTDRYNVAGITSTAFTNPNHRGAYDGPFDPAATPPYTIIPNQPATRDRQIVDLGWTAQNYVSVDVDMATYQLSLSPSLSFAASKRLALNFMPKLGMQIVYVSVNRVETFSQTQGGTSTTLQTWSDGSDKTKVAMVLGLSGGANLDLGKGWFTGIFGGYEWVMEDADLAIGPNRVSVDASGWTAGLVFGKTF